MTEKPEVLTEAELESVQGGSLLLPAVQQVREARPGEKFFDEADAVIRKPNGKRVLAEGGANDI